MVVKKGGGMEEDDDINNIICRRDERGSTLPFEHKSITTPPPPLVITRLPSAARISLAYFFLQTMAVRKKKKSRRARRCERRLTSWSWVALVTMLIEGYRRHSTAPFRAELGLLELGRRPKLRLQNVAHNNRLLCPHCVDVGNNFCKKSVCVPRRVQVWSNLIEIDDTTNVV